MKGRDVREFRGAYSDARPRRARRDYSATGAIISLPRNGSFVKAKPAAMRVRGGCISVIQELE